MVCKEYKLRVLFLANSVRKKQLSHRQETKGSEQPAHVRVFHHENIPIFDPIKPHFYIVKLGFTGVYIIFLISAQKHRL